MAIGVTAIAIAVMLLASNFTLINAQPQQVTSQPGEIENGTTTFQSTSDSFSIQVPSGWIIQDVDNAGPAQLEEVRQGYGILVQLCPEEQQGAAAAASNASGGSTNTISNINASRCQGAQEVIHIIRYPDLDTRLSANNVTTTNNNLTTTDNILTYHLQKLQEVGYRSMQIVNSTDMTSNLRDPQTNETITTVPGKLVEMTYSTNFAPNEIKRGYFILTATNSTVPNVGTTKGYGVFYEGNSTTTPAEITTPATSLPPSPVVGQVFDSFELIAAPEVAQASAEAAEGGDDDDDDDEDNGADDDDDDEDNGADDDDDDEDNGADDDDDDEDDGDNGDGGEGEGGEGEGGGGEGGGGEGGGGEGGGGEGSENEFGGCEIVGREDVGDVGC
jgi:uncharacterized membrane protein YgcG